MINVKGYVRKQKGKYVKVRGHNRVGEGAVNRHPKNEYDSKAERFLRKTGTSFKATYKDYKYYFPDDTDMREVYNITLKNHRGSWTFTFGQSIAGAGKEPTPYDILASITKYDPEDFEFFCRNYGYEFPTPSAKKVYNAVVKEWNNVQRIFSSDEIEMLREID